MDERLYLPSRAENQDPCGRRDVKTQFLESVQQRGNLLNKARALRIEQDAECSHEMEPQSLRDAACDLVINHGDGIRPLNGQHQDFRLSLSKISDQPLGRHGGRLADADPAESFGHRNIVSRFPPGGEFPDDRRGHKDAVSQFGQPAQMPELVKVLQRRRIAEEFTQGGFPLRTDPR